MCTRLILTVISILLNGSILGGEFTEMPKKQHVNVGLIEETLDKIAQQTEDFVEVAKSVQTREVYEKPETIDDVLDAFEQRYRSLKKIRYWFQLLNNAEAAPLRKNVLDEWLPFWKMLSESFDQKHDFSIPVYINLGVNGPYPSGIDPKHIKEPDIRKDYEERLDKNTQLFYVRRVQLKLRQLLEDATEEIETFVVNAYMREPRADDELIQAMEKHELPEDIRVKILSKIGIAYRVFRDWASTDGLFKEIAKFVSLEEDVVTLEKADGSTTTIEFSALRELDRDYIRLLMECDKKAEETSDDDSDVSPTRPSQQEETNIMPDPAKWFSPPFGTDVLRLTDGSGNVIYPYSTGHPDETRSKTETTRTTVVIPKSQLNVTYESHSSPPPPLYSNRLKIGLTIYAAFIAIVFALYFYLRFRWQRSQSAS